MTTPKRLRVMLATPLKHHRGPEDLPPQIGRALKELHERRNEHEYEFEFAAACGGLCSARNRLVHDFLHKSDAQILRWWDSDLHDQAGKDADHILRQLTVMRANGAHVMGSLYTTRQKRPRWVANFMPAAKVQADGLIQVAELGMGAKAYSRRALEELRRIYVEVAKANGTPTMEYRDRETGEMITAFHQIRLVDGDLLSEDYFTDWICRCAKLPIWADTIARCRQLDGDELFPALDQPWPPLPVTEESK